MSEQLTVEWRNLTYLVEKRDDRFWSLSAFRKPEYETVLHGVNGRIQAGSLTAILGASGAGKTTLLASVSQRIRGKFSGDILINGRAVTCDEMSKLSGFVSQYDISIASLTAREHLHFMKFGLAKCEHTKISMLSGGEKRKLNLATELITEPAILFCDEPTTGLDSYNALSVVRTLKELAIDTRMARDDYLHDNGNKYFALDSAQMELLPNGEESEDSMEWKEHRSKKAVVCSIHQPTSEVFEYFSHIILMSSGRILFQGTNCEAATFFSRFGLNCPALYNPAEFYIQIMAGQITGGNKLIDLRHMHNEYLKKVDGEIAPTAEQTDCRSPVDDMSVQRCSWFYQLYILMLRSVIDTRRNYRTHVLECALLMLTAVTIMLLYGKIRPTSQTAIQDIRGAIFLISTEVLFTFTYCVLWIIPAQLPLLRREIGEKVYRLSAFYVSKVLLLIVPAFVYSFMFLGIVYSSVDFIVDFRTYLQMSLSLTMAGLGACAYGCVLSSFTDSPRLITELASPIDVVLMVLAGAYISVKTVPYIKYISFFFYANETMSIDYWATVESIDCNEATEMRCLRNGTEVLEFLGYSTTRFDVYVDYASGIVVSLLCHIVAFLGLRRFIRKAGFY